jgi:UDP-N-acetyl-D-glucosamine dehydrogenase
LTIPRTREHVEMTGRESEEWHAKLSADYDVVLIVTDHDVVDYEMLVKHSELVIDTRNACRRAGVFSDRIVLA